MKSLSTQLLVVLHQHKILPGIGDFDAACARMDAGCDLLPVLGEVWRRACTRAVPPTCRRRAARIADSLEAARGRGAELTFSLPGLDDRHVASWIGERLIWWPRGVPPGERLAVVSSRLGRPVERRPGFFAALRRVCREFDSDHQILITAKGTATAPYLQRCSQLFQLPLLLFQLPRPGRRLERWFCDCLADARYHDRAWPASDSADPPCWPASVSPPLRQEPTDPSPLRDRLMVCAGDRIVACHIRPGGHVGRLLERRLSESTTGARSRVVLATGDQLVSPAVAARLQDLGAEATSIDNVPSFPLLVPVSDVVTSEIKPGQILLLKDVPLADYLTHCTRCAHGPWPDQSVAEYLDALVLGRPETDHSSLATLSRIVSMSRLIASGKAIRCGVGVVCFTAVPLGEIPRLRKFRAHRGRWDFEPYGISIQRGWLEQRGVRPVCYGDPVRYRRLPPSERPYFQRRIAGKGDQIDWSIEREWRHVGDVDLRDLPADAAFVFVKTVAEAQQLRPLSRWPVVVIT